MRFKRVLISSLVCILTLSLLIAAASAHGGHHGRGGGRCGQRVQTSISVCTIDGCSVAGRHVHDGTVYCGYDHENGYCSGACLPLCSEAGCTLTGRHVHNSVTYCGNDHSCGFCDGSCSVSARRGCCH